MHRRSSRFLPVFLIAGLVLPMEGSPAWAEPVDLEMVTRIREEGFRNSQAVEVAAHLTNVIGPRLTGSPAMKEANEWTRKKLAEWGLANARLEPYEFGRGWSFTRSAVHMVRPQQVPLTALPKAWTPGTGGPVRGLAMRVDLSTEADLELHRGKLAGKILFLEGLKVPAVREEPRRFSESELAELAEYEIPGQEENRDYSRRFGMRRKIREFLVQEKVAATVDPSSRGLNVVRVGSGGSYRPGEDPGVPALMMAVESYNRVVRLLDAGQEVEIEVDVQSRFHDEDTKAYNTIAEIPGTDKKDEIVIVGAHLDSWHGATGATDNAAGVAMMMEAVRILKALEVKPRRTIRIALWSGEEQGLYGAEAHVAQHFGTWSGYAKQPDLPTDMIADKGELKLKPAHAKLSAYYNLDNGAGKIRGIYAQSNAAVAPIFADWLRPLHDLGATTVTLRDTDHTDHVPFDQVGLPGFQFIQDELDYTAFTHHTNIDTYERLVPEDLKQAAVVVATFLYHTAMRSELLPRKALPTK